MNKENETINVNIYNRADKLLYEQLKLVNKASKKANVDELCRLSIAMAELGRVINNQ